MLKSYKEKKRYYRLPNGDYYELKNNKEYDFLFGLLERDKTSLKELVEGNMHLPLYRAFYLDKCLENQPDIKAIKSESFNTLVETFKNVKDKDYALKVLGIDRGNAKPSKYIAKWSDVKNIIYYMYDEKFDKNGEFEYQKITDKDEIEKIVKTYFEKYYDENDDKQTWFNKMKDLSEEMGYAREVKEYKANPDAYKGHVGDISTVIRVKLTGRCNTPDLYEIMQVIGKERLLKRI